MQNIQDQLNTIIKLFNNGEKQNALNKISLLLTTNEKNIYNASNYYTYKSHK